MIHLLHWRSSEGPLWLTYWGYTYIWCAVGVLHITVFHWCEISNKTLGGPLIISQTARWTIQCTADHRRGRFDCYTRVYKYVWYIVGILHIIQLSIDLRYSTRSLQDHPSYHKQPDGTFHAPRITGQADRRPTYQIRQNLSVGQRQLEYELCKTLSVGWEYQSHKPWLNIGCHWCCQKILPMVLDAPTVSLIEILPMVSYEPSVVPETCCRKLQIGPLAHNG